SLRIAGFSELAQWANFCSACFRMLRKKRQDLIVLTSYPITVPYVPAANGTVMLSYHRRSNPEGLMPLFLRNTSAK
ncbi:hypothetical protein PDENDC454_20140, partial [Paenibacillus dendritiformis C454]